MRSETSYTEEEDMKITIRRGYLPSGTFGDLEMQYSPNRAPWGCCTVERPWLDNSPNISCIPEGTYRIFRSYYNKGDYECFEVEGVYGRSLIKIHIANWPSNVQGCIGLGKSIVPLVPLSNSGDPQVAVASSKATFNEFMKLMEGIDEAELVITHKTS
jgi:hypothetical protein